MSDFELIPQQAVEHLLANPDTVAGFDQVFGSGRATEVLSSQTPTPTKKETDEDGMSLLGKIWDSTGRAVSYGVQEAASETLDAAESLYEFGNREIGGRLNSIGIPTQLDLWDDEEGKLQFKLMTYEESKGQSNPLFGVEGQKGDAVDINLVKAPETFTGGIVGGITQFVAGFAGASKFTKMAGLRGAFVNGAIADAVVFDPNDPNVMKMLDGFGLDTGAVGEALATDPDEDEYINRLRNVAEGAAFGGIVEAIGWSVKAARAAKAGDMTSAKAFTEQQDAALKELDEALAVSGKELVDDAQETLSLTKEIFDDFDVDGQMRLDLGDTLSPREVPEGDPRSIYVTPEKAEKIRLQTRLATTEPTAVKQEGLSFRSLNTVTDFKDVLDDIAGTRAVLADEFATVKGGDVQRWTTVKAQSMAKLRQMAEMTGEDPKALLKRFMSADLGDVDKIAAEVHARSSYLLTVEKDLKGMAKAITDGVFDPKQFPGIQNMDHLKLAFVQRREVAANLLAGQDALRSNVARAMNAMKMAVEPDAGIQNMLKNPRMFDDIDAAARAVVDPANADKSAIRTVNSALEAVGGYMNTINTVRINALLSGPGTQEVNMISNVVNSFLIPAEQAIGGLVKGDTRAAAHAARQMQGYVLGIMDSVRSAKTAGWYNDAVLDPFNSKIEEAELLQANNAAMKVVTLPSRALMTMDEFFKQSQYRGRVFADAHEEALNKGLKGSEKDDFIRAYLKDSYDEAGAGLREDALLQSRRATFTEPLEGNLSVLLQNAAIKSPYVRFIVPFVRTPINILSQTLQHVPVAGALSHRWREDIAAGGARAAQARGKWMVGAGLIAMAGHMASSGQITGSGPSDPRIRKVWLENNQPYAFKIDNEDGTVQWVSYARLEPLSNIFSISADMAEIINDPFNEADTKNAMGAMFMAVMENTVNKTFTQGISDAMDAFNGQPHEQERALNNFIASFVPNILNQTNGDEAMREARTLTDTLMARTHLYNQVDPKRNVLGEALVRRLPKYDPLGLSYKDERVIDPVMEEITRVAILNQTVADGPGKTIPGPNKVNLTEVPYTEGQSLYDKWVELTGEVKIGGKTLREELKETMNSRSYRAAPDGAVGVTTGTKGAIIRKIIGAYRRKAKGSLPELREIIRAERMGGANILREQAKSNRQLFPSTNSDRVIQRRSFEDLLK